MDIAAGATIKPPTTCPSKKIKPCKGKTFRHMTEVQQHTDVQEVRLQEDSQKTAGGTARAVDVIVQDELVDVCQAGGTASSINYENCRRTFLQMNYMPKDS